ncbi:FtsH protease activity modulator HflK [Polycladidibacter hongkongensis]|uniref:FtsH protease activity modulator HflK n=1 Tax=Polycladidibacter hongkongensis TaxID=1647556 RepID=UPI00082A3BB1|nr:FtsH protease activity modulator HflK [Pseudovibrio hongkongensis]
MPWSNQSGGGGNNGPWGSPGGGNGGGNGGGGGPWGGGPQRGGGNTPPDFDELLKRGQDQLKGLVPGGGGRGLGALGLVLVVGAAAALWLATGIYRVEEGQRGVELVFGEVASQVGPGLNYNWPYPIGSTYTPNVDGIREVTVGMKELVRGSRVSQSNVPQESLMLTGDENIVDVNFKVQWRVDPSLQGIENFLFHVENPEATVKAVSESTMREVVGTSRIDDVMTSSRNEIQNSVAELMQKALDEYTAGVVVTDVKLLRVDPPSQVIEAFRDVQAARADQERIQNEAQAYANRVVPEARGNAARVLEAASAYKEKVVADATGEAARFEKILEQYKRAPDVTRQRMYLETMENVLSRNKKIIIDSDNGGVVPYLPLDQLNKSTKGGAN